MECSHSCLQQVFWEIFDKLDVVLLSCVWPPQAKHRKIKLVNWDLCDYSLSQILGRLDFNGF